MSDGDLVERLLSLHPRGSGYAEIGREAAAEITRLQAERERLTDQAKHACSWLRQNASAEKEPKARAAFIEAHNAVLSILEGREDRAALATEAGVGGPPRKPVCPDCMGMGRRGVLACNACGATGQVG